MAKKTKETLRYISPGLSSAGGIRKNNEFVAASVWEHGEEGMVGRFTFGKDVIRKMGLKVGVHTSAAEITSRGVGWFKLQFHSKPTPNSKPLRCQKRTDAKTGRRVPCSTLWFEYRLDRGRFPFSKKGYKYASRLELDKEAKCVRVLLTLPKRKCPACGGEGYVQVLESPKNGKGGKASKKRTRRGE